MRITLAVLAILAAACVSALVGPGSGGGGVAVLAALYLALVVLPDPGREKAVSALLWVSVVVAGSAVAQMPFIPRPPSLFVSPNYLGAFAAIMLFLPDLPDGRRLRPPTEWTATAWVKPLAIGANATSLCLAQSRGALLAVGAGCCVMLWRHSRIAALAAPIIAIVAVLMIRAGGDQSVTERLEVWEAALYGVKWHLVTGNGFDAPLVFANGMFYRRFYSVPIDWFAATGLLGAAAGAWLLVEASRRGPEFHPFLAAWLVQGLFISAHPATMVPFFVVLALAAGAGAAGVERDEAGVAGVVLHRQPL